MMASLKLAASILNIFSGQPDNNRYFRVAGKDMLATGITLVLLCFTVFHKFILGEAVYLFNDIGSDSLNIYYPAYINVAYTLWSGNLPGWSFEQGMGQNVFPFSLSDPTVYLLYLLGSDKLATGIVWVEILKITGSGLLFFCFLKKLSLDNKVAYIGSLLYAFSGFMVVGGSWYVFSTIGLYMALLLLSFEMLYTEGKWWLYPVCIALIAAFNFVNLYTCSSFLLLYVLFRLFTQEELNLKKLSTLFFQLLLLGLLGLLISSVFSIPNLVHMLDSARVSGEASYAISLSALPVFETGNAYYLITILMRFFSSDLLGNGSAFVGWGNYLEAPMVYCGLICLLLVPQVLGFLKSRQIIVYGVFLGIFIFAGIFPWFRRGFWLFQGDYFRDLSLHVSIILILFSMTALHRLLKSKGADLPILAGTFVALLILLYFPHSLSITDINGNAVKWESVVDQSVEFRVVLLLILLTASVISCSSTKYGKYAQLCLIATVLTELACFSYTSVNERSAIPASSMLEKAGYNDHSVEAIAFIKQQDIGFFRIEKNYGSSPAKQHESINDSKVQHYFGTSSYSSFNSSNYINFLSTNGVLFSQNELDTRWSSGVRDFFLLQVLTGVKYFLFKGELDTHSALAKTYENIAQFGDVSVLKSRYALPLGVAYDTYMAESDFDKLDARRKRIALLKAIVVPNDLEVSLPDMIKYSSHDIPSDYPFAEVKKDTDKLKSNSLRINHFSSNRIEGTIDARIRQLVFFSFPFDRGWVAKVNGKEEPVIMVDGGLSALMLKPGSNRISLEYSPPFVSEGLSLTLLGLLVFGAMIFRQAMLSGWRLNMTN